MKLLLLIVILFIFILIFLIQAVIFARAALPQRPIAEPVVLLRTASETCASLVVFVLVVEREGEPATTRLRLPTSTRLACEWLLSLEISIVIIHECIVNILIFEQRIS